MTARTLDRSPSKPPIHRSPAIYFHNNLAINPPTQTNTSIRNLYPLSQPFYPSKVSIITSPSSIAPPIILTKSCNTARPNSPSSHSFSPTVPIINTVYPARTHHSLRRPPKNSAFSTAYSPRKNKKKTKKILESNAPISSTLPSSHIYQFQSIQAVLRKRPLSHDPTRYTICKQDVHLSPQ